MWLDGVLRSESATSATPRPVRIVITDKTYPNPSAKYSETLCTAGVALDTHNFVRLYPVRFRDLPYGQWFKKWEVIEADVMHKIKDTRNDTYTPVADSIKSVDEYYKGKKPDWVASEKFCKLPSGLRPGGSLRVFLGEDELGEHGSAFCGGTRVR